MEGKGTDTPRKFTFEREGFAGLSKAALEGEDPHIRQMAAILLGSMEEGRAVPTLIDALHDEDKAVRARAAYALEKIGAPAVPSLTGALGDPSWVVRYRAAEALGGIGDRTATAALALRCADPKDHIRYMAAKSLAALGDPVAIPAIEPLCGDENPYVRKMAAEALEKLGKVK